LLQLIKKYGAWGLSLFPLSPRDGKRPAEAGWRHKKYSDNELLLHYNKSDYHNLGVRLEQQHLVLDVDAKCGGDMQLIALTDKYPFLLDAPWVLTGGGGVHIYLTLPTGFNCDTKLRGYDAIDIRKKGNYVVAAGSMHKKYSVTYEPVRFDLLEMPRPQSEFLLFCERKGLVATDCNRDNIETISIDELSDILSRLDAAGYRDHENWFKIFAAAYHATGGEGLAVFLKWSLSDKKYADDRDKIIQRWPSLETEGRQYTVATLIAELRKKGDDYQLSDRTLCEQLDNFDINKNETSMTSSSAMMSHDEIIAALDEIKNVDALTASQKILDLMKQTGLTKTVLDNALREIKKSADYIDVPEAVSSQLLRERYNSGDTLIYALDGRYWHYNQKYWTAKSSDLIKKEIKNYAEGYRVEHAKVKFGLSTVITSGEIIMRAATARDKDLLGAQNAPRSIINCQNCELWINKDGTITRREHAAKSFLTYCLDIDYDERADCKIFDDTLSGIFEPLPDGKNVIRHLWEVIGYTIQPRKFIPSWFLLQGHGANGKSLILDVLIELLGPAARPVASISELSAQHSEFALSECVGALAIIDDDVRKDTVLNDDIIKKLSEDKIIRARFLQKNYFSFRNCATIILAANNWPKTRDLSDGMMRRAYGFPFRRQFVQDSTRKRNIIDTELPGILNKALAGFLRLQKRGEFDVPDSCSELIEKWKSKSNHLLRFLNDVYHNERWENAKLFDSFKLSYEGWCAANGVRKTYTRHGLIDALESMGFVVNGLEIGKAESTCVTTEY
jgi:P4 family phage/plasmid primase-like protien